MPAVRVKVCGITNKDDAIECVKAGAHALGFIFFEKSPRYIPPERAREIILSLPPFVNKVGVFVNEDSKTIRHIKEYCLLDYIQLHGDEGIDICDLFQGRVIKAFRLKDELKFIEIEQYLPHVQGILLDTWSKTQYGGTGETFNWELAKKAKNFFKVPLILAGGLSPKNIQDAIYEVRPFGVDVSSGLEKAPGVKDYDLIREFFHKINSI